jgi:hypothetical protein
MSAPICIGRPLITILANEGAWAASDGGAVVAADDLFKANPYDEIARLRSARRADLWVTATLSLLVGVAIGACLEAFGELLMSFSW